MKYSMYLEKSLNLKIGSKNELHSQILGIFDLKKEDYAVKETTLKLIITHISKDILDINNEEHLNKILFLKNEISKAQKEAKRFLNNLVLKNLDDAATLLEINEELSPYIKDIYFKKSHKIVNNSLVDEEIVVFNKIESVFYYLISEYLKEKRAVVRCVHCGEILIEANRIQISNVRSGSNALHEKCRSIYRKEKDSKRKRKRK